MGVDVVSEIARLRVSIDRTAAAIETTLACHQGVFQDDESVAEWKELCRQLGALRERVAVAESGNDDPRALHAELATLFSFGRTLQADADRWRSGLEQRIKHLERRRMAAHLERQRLVTERVNLAQRRDGLQSRIVQTAARMAKRDGGEWRRTLPVFALGEGLTICSVTVSCPRKGLRFSKQWLVTLNGSRDGVMVRRE